MVLFTGQVWSRWDIVGRLSRCLSTHVWCCQCLVRFDRCNLFSATRCLWHTMLIPKSLMKQKDEFNHNWWSINERKHVLTYLLLTYLLANHCPLIVSEFTFSAHFINQDILIQLQICNKFCCLFDTGCLFSDWHQTKETLYL